MAPLTEINPNVPGTDGSTRKNTKLNAGKKRTRDECQTDPDSIDIPDGTPMDMTCNQVRSKIRAFVNSGEMKVGEFQDKLGVSGNSYRNFLGQNGNTKGMESETYYAAFEFFKKRELAGVKMPRKKTKIAVAKDGKDEGAVTGSKTAIKAKEDDKKYDVSDVHLDGEEDEMVPIYDTCDDVRRKINAHLRESSVTQAAFLRDIGKMLPGQQSLSSQRLKTFLGNKGSVDGNDSPVFYAGYVWFEKLRIKNGKKKSKKREEMEEIWSKEGGIQDITSVYQMP